jgi:hypothetical protein
MVYVAYAYVGLLHAFLVGVTYYVWVQPQKRKWLHAVIIFLILLSLETYWIPVFDFFELKITTTDKDLIDRFGLIEGQNIVDQMRSVWWKIISCAIQTPIALISGNYAIKRILSK